MKILIIQTAYLGDLILTTPLINQTKIAYPDSKISILVIPQTSEILSGQKMIDEVIVYDKKKFGNLFTLSPYILNRIYSRFDIVLSPHQSPRSSLIAFFSGAKIRVGFRDSALPFLFTHKAKYEGSHVVEKYSNLIDELGFNIPPLKLSLYADNDDIERFIKLLGIKNKGLKPLVGVFPLSEWETKTPPISLVIESLKKAMTKKLFIPIFIGKESNQVLSEFIKNEIDGIDLMGKTDLHTLKGIVSLLDIIISGDSAGVHIASAFSKPVVVIYGATRPGQGYYPWMVEYRAIMADVSCSPCTPHGSNRCPLGHFNCMKGISQVDLTDSIIQLLNHKSDNHKK